MSDIINIPKKSGGQALRDYLNPEYAESGTVRKFLGNLYSNVQEMTGTDEATQQAHLQGYNAAKAEIQDMLKQDLTPLQREQVRLLAQRWGVNLASNVGAVSPVRGSIKLARQYLEELKNRKINAENKSRLDFDNNAKNENLDLDEYWIKKGKSEIDSDKMNEDEYNNAVNEYANLWRIDELLRKNGWKRTGVSNQSSSSYYQKDFENDVGDYITHEIRVSDHADKHIQQNGDANRIQINFRLKDAPWSNTSISPYMKSNEAELEIAKAIKSAIGNR